MGPANLSAKLPKILTARRGDAPVFGYSARVSIGIFVVAFLGAIGVVAGDSDFGKSTYFDAFESFNSASRRTIDASQLARTSWECRRVGSVDSFETGVSNNFQLSWIESRRWLVPTDDPILLPGRNPEIRALPFTVRESRNEAVRKVVDEIPNPHSCGAMVAPRLSKNRFMQMHRLRSTGREIVIESSTSVSDLRAIIERYENLLGLPGLSDRCRSDIESNIQWASALLNSYSQEVLPTGLVEGNRRNLRVLSFYHCRSKSFRKASPVRAEGGSPLDWRKVPVTRLVLNSKALNFKCHVKIEPDKNIRSKPRNRVRSYAKILSSHISHDPKGNANAKIKWRFRVGSGIHEVRASFVEKKLNSETAFRFAADVFELGLSRVDSPFERDLIEPRVNAYEIEIGETVGQHPLYGFARVRCGLFSDLPQ